MSGKEKGDNSGGGEVQKILYSENYSSVTFERHLSFLDLLDLIKNSRNSGSNGRSVCGGRVRVDSVF